MLDLPLLRFRLWLLVLVFLHALLELGHRALFLLLENGFGGQIVEDPDQDLVDDLDPKGRPVQEGQAQPHQQGVRQQAEDPVGEKGKQLLPKIMLMVDVVHEDGLVVEPEGSQVGHDKGHRVVDD